LPVVARTNSGDEGTGRVRVFMENAQPGGANGTWLERRKPHSVAVIFPSIHHRLWMRSITAHDDNSRAAPNLTYETPDFFAVSWDQRNKICAIICRRGDRRGDSAAPAAQSSFVWPQKSPGDSPGL